MTPDKSILHAPLGEPWPTAIDRATSFIPTEEFPLPPTERERVRMFEDGRFESSIQQFKAKYLGEANIDSVEFESDLRRLFGPVDGLGGS